MSPDPPRKDQEDFIDHQQQDQLNWIANFEQVEDEDYDDDDDDEFPDDDSLILIDDESSDEIPNVFSNNSEFIDNPNYYAAIALEEMDNEMPSPPSHSPPCSPHTHPSSSDEESDSENEQVVEDMKQDNENDDMTWESNIASGPVDNEDEDNINLNARAHYQMLIPFPASTVEEADGSAGAVGGETSAGAGQNYFQVAETNDTQPALTVKIKPVEDHQEVTVDDSAQNEIIKSVMSKFPAPEPPNWAKNLDDKEWVNVVDHIRKTRKTSSSSSTSSTHSQPKNIQQKL